MNKVIYDGRLVYEPELKEVNGKPVFDNVIASKKNYSKDGTNFKAFRVWNPNLAKYLSTYAKKGGGIILYGYEAQFQDNKDPENKKQYENYIVENATLFGFKDKEEKKVEPSMFEEPESFTDDDGLPF